MTLSAIAHARVTVVLCGCFVTNPLVSGMRAKNMDGNEKSEIYRMPPSVMDKIKLKMPEGKGVSVGFEFECANKKFTLTQPLPYDWKQCPAVEFPMNGRSKAKPVTMLPGFYGLDPADFAELDMDRWDAMPAAVKNIVWTKDAFSGDHGPDCAMVQDPRGIQTFTKVPNRGRVNGDTFHNNGQCDCTYTLEYKTLPMHTPEDIREAMIGAALTLREASKRVRENENSTHYHFKGWNVGLLFKMDASVKEPCTGATHVTKAYEINKKSLIDMLNQQMFGYCAKQWPKEMSGDKVFRTAFAEAYMLWRARDECEDDEECRSTLTLTDMCDKYWDQPERAQKDVDAHLFADATERAKVLGNVFFALQRYLDGNATFDEWSKTGPCTPGVALAQVCSLTEYLKIGTIEDVLLNDPTLGFGDEERYNYYGPGGGKGDTTTKVGAMIDADGTTLYGLAEHRKELWNTKNFKHCIYSSLKSAKDFEDGEEKFDRSKFCKVAIEAVSTVDYA